MATTGKINTTALAIYVGTTKVTHATDGSLSLSADMRDTTTKDSAGWKEIIPGLKSGSMSVSTMYAIDATYGFSQMFTAFVAKTALTIKFSTEVTGDKAYSASCYISSLEMNSPGQEDNATCSATFEINGAMTEITIV